jgi:hypothetical protein
MEDWTWGQVERILQRSIRLGGGFLSFDDEDVLERAYAKDPSRYIELHKRLKYESVAEMSPLARKE